MTYKKTMLVLVLLISLIVAMTGCGNNKQATDDNNKQDQETKKDKKQDQDKVKDESDSGPHPTVIMTMKDGGKVEIELYPNKAPNTVNNFISLINDDFYDGLTFHRVISDFMIQGGDPDGDGSGGPGYHIKGEFTSNGFDNGLKHKLGVISMARSKDPDSAGSQFFIVTGDASQLDGDYAAFGKVIDGMDVVRKIEAVDTGEHDKPKTDQVIKSMSVDLHGYKAKAPEKQDD